MKQSLSACATTTPIKQESSVSLLNSSPVTPPPFLAATKSQPNPLSAPLNLNSPLNPSFPHPMFPNPLTNMHSEGSSSIGNLPKTPSFVNPMFLNSNSQNVNFHKSHEILSSANEILSIPSSTIKEEISENLIMEKHGTHYVINFFYES